MKKILFTFLSALALFSSCSSDNDTFTENVSDSNNEPKYTVNFDIKSDAFEVDKTPLRSLDYQDTYVQMIVYKEAGEVYSDTVLPWSYIKEIISKDGILPLSFTLPQGNYHLAFIHNPISAVTIGGAYTDIPDRFLLLPTNFYTDIENAGGIKGSYTSFSPANTGNYYQTVDISVNSSTNNQSLPIILEPMWSRVSVTIEDSKTLAYPIKATAIWLDFVPAYTGYELSSKLAFHKLDSQALSSPNFNHGLIWMQDFIKYNNFTIGFEVSKTQAINNNMKLIIRFQSDFINSENYTISKYEIDLNTQVENGLNYKISGKLGNLENLDGGQLNLTFAPFAADGTTELPFE